MTDPEKVKRDLEARLDQLRQRVNHIKQDLGEPADPDFAERATEAENDEVLEGIGRASEAEIRQIHAALERIEEGTYGVCRVCEETIDPRRLEALPFVTTCIKCAESSGQSRT